MKKPRAKLFIPVLAVFALVAVVATCLIVKALRVHPDDHLIAQWLQEEVQPTMAARQYLRADCIAQLTVNHSGAELTPLDEQACYNASVAQHPLKEFAEWKAEHVE
jgi:hypothetical protein